MKHPLWRRSLWLMTAAILLLAGLSSCTRNDNPGDETTGDTDEITDAPTDAETDAPLTTSRVTADPGIPGVDFLLEIPEGHEPRILVVADTQTTQLVGVRETTNNHRYNQVKNAFFNSSRESYDEDIRAWRYVEEGIKNQDPDLVVMVGDIIYGQTDDSGKQWLRMIERMDSYGVPWAVTFGNHDNESAKGVRWQIERVQNSEYGILKQGSVTGNSNYTIAVKQGDKFVSFLVMLDTNGVHVYDNPGEGLNSDNVDIDLLYPECTLLDDQVTWVKQAYAEFTEHIGEKPDAYWFFHVPPKEAATACFRRYERNFPLTLDRGTDFGTTLSSFSGFSNANFWWAAKSTNCKGMFMGHCHLTSISVMTTDGIRLTFGLKTGTYDSHNRDMLGTTLMTLKESGASVKHCYTELPYYEVPCEKK